MEETRIDRLESRFDELEKEFRTGLRAVETRLCKVEDALIDVEVRLGKIEVLQSQSATKSDLNDLRVEMYRNNADMKTWLLGTMITIIALFSVAVFGLRHWNG